MTADSIARQRAYYRATAADYDSMHPFTEHYVGLRHVVIYIKALGYRSVLDTGCGTGLALRYLLDHLPDLEVHGNDPSDELLRIAIEQHGVPAERLTCASSAKLPYSAEEFDVVVETGMLHHVPNPQVVVAEMLRVAKQAIFISDTNLFGMGSLPARVAKLALRRAGLLRSVNRRRRNGNDWYYTADDGVAWDYSVFDSLSIIRDACAEVVVIPTGQSDRHADAMPLLLSSHCLVIGLKQPLLLGTVK